MKKLLKKKNNKGFSLVELIVVVLIMAIIAVALSPQVLKWVEKSRQATDAQNYDALIADLQIALTNKTAYADAKNATKTNPIKLTITDTGAAFEAGKDSSDNEIAATNIEAALKSVQDDWASVKVKAASAPTGGYVIEIYQGAVWRTTNAPDTEIEEDLATPSSP